MLSLLLLINGVVETVGGLASIIVPEKVTDGNGKDLRLARTLGVATLSIGVISFLAYSSLYF